MSLLPTLGDAGKLIPESLHRSDPVTQAIHTLSASIALIQFFP